MRKLTTSPGPWTAGEGLTIRDAYGESVLAYPNFRPLSPQGNRDLQLAALAPDLACLVLGILGRPLDRAPRNLAFWALADRVLGELQVLLDERQDQTTGTTSGGVDKT